MAWVSPNNSSALGRDGARQWYMNRFCIVPGKGHLEDLNSQGS